ncbi:hypothetical protein [Chitinimonas lacunae]|uniref:3-oxoacyl-[acyl-carrier-protein] synthase-1 n=1 Tax=Chitinimonas lacunae TaxID=1963018 RepID=A0ABV8MU04_9NEIS
MTLQIGAAGLCCAVGYRLDAAVCALRAQMDNFRESDFVCHSGEPVRVARLPDAQLWGSQRLARWVERAVRDCLRRIADFDSTTTPLLLLVPEQERPHSSVSYYQEIFSATEHSLDCRFHPLSRIVPWGRAGLGPALQTAQRWLSEGEVQQVLLVGVDSYLNSATIEYYLEAERLLVPGNRDGFLPGEAAAALLLLPAAAGRPGLRIEGVATAREEGRPDGSVPSRAFGLTRAIRQACERAGRHPHHLGFRMSDQNGEAFFAKEAANALTRVMFDGGPQLPVLQIADCLGEIGAATGPAMLALLSETMQREDGPGQLGLLHLANDDGARTALVVSYG